MEEESKFISVISNQIKSQQNSYILNPIKKQNEFIENMNSNLVKKKNQRKYSQNKRNKNIFVILLKCFIIFTLTEHKISSMNTNRALQSNSSFILLKSSYVGTQNILASDYNGGYPDKIYLNENLVEGTPTNAIDLPSTDLIIKLEWNDKINNCKNMFKGLGNLTEIDLSNFDSSLVTDTSFMFSSCSSLTSINLNNFITSSVRNMAGMFRYCSNLLSIDFSNFDTSLVTTFDEFLRSCNKLISVDVSSFNTSLVTDMGVMFREETNLKFLDLSNFDTSRVTRMYGMFSFCTSLTSLVLTSFNTSAVKIFSYFLEGCNHLIEVNVKNFDTSSAIDMQGMFSNCMIITELDVSNFNIKNVVKINSMFNDCENLLSINLSNFDTSNVDKMDSLFKNCQKLTSIDLYNFDTSKVTDMRNMFRNCKTLTSINLSNFNTNSCTDYSNMFYDCQNLKYIRLNNFYETNTTLFDNFIDESNTELNLCFNITNNSRLYQNYKEHFIKECLFDFKEDTPTTEIIKESTQQQYYTSFLETTNYFQTSIYNETLNNYLDNINTQINDIIQRYLNKSFDIDEINENIHYEVQMDDILVRFTTTNYLKNHTNDNKTSIDLGTCESILKTSYNISENYSLYVLLSEVPQDGIKIPKVGYEVFEINDKNDLIQLNLSVCGDEKIEISIPVNINEDIDIYNSSSGYYNDICYPTKSNNGFDICLNDRRNEFIDNNLTLCEENCDLVGYDNVNKKAKCSCDIKKDSPLIDNIKIDKEKLKKNFIDIDNIANIKFMKCYKIVFKKENIKKNWGFYILGFIFCLFLICLFLFYFKYYKIFFGEIGNMFLDLKYKKTNMENVNNKKNKIQNPPTKEKKKKSKKKNKKQKRRKKKESDNKIIVFSNEQNKTNSLMSSKYIPNTNNTNNTNIDYNLDYTDSELNSLPYNEAIILDKRTYWQYYVSLLKKYHLLLFSFYPNEDYNSRIIKIFLFFFFFSAHFTINALFYTDSTMHQIYEDEGAFNFIYQIPQILYSSIISALIGTLVKFFSLSEKNILQVKQEKKKNPKDINNKIKKLFICLKIKFAVFFIVTPIILIVFWYYITCFCAIYKNTQSHLIKDSLISFLMSLIYPFGLLLLPGIFRRIALKAEKADKNLLYKFSQLLEYI